MAVTEAVVRGVYGRRKGGGAEKKLITADRETIV